MTDRTHTFYAFGDGNGTVRVEIEAQDGSACWTLTWGGISGQNWKATRFLSHPELQHEPLGDEANCQVQGRWRRVDDLLSNMSPWLEEEFGTVLEAMVAGAVLKPMLVLCEREAQAKTSGRIFLAERYGVDLFVEEDEHEVRFWDRV